MEARPGLTSGQRALRGLAIAATCVYVAWNAWWLSGGVIPPSMLYGLTGIPSPTTGGTRSLLALLAGDWSASLRHNAMTVPLIGLLALSLAWPLTQRLRGRAARLPVAFLWAWGLTLGLAWVLKLLIAPP